MEDLIDLIATDASASDIRDKIHDILYSKAAERIEIAKPLVAASMFGEGDNNTDETEQNYEENE
jgi:hypothetical protein